MVGYTLFIVAALVTLLPFLADGLSARGRTADGSEEWGYIPVRPGASMFYWFYRTTHPDGYKNRPIVLWLQGGPGLSGTGLGNFLEIGPLDQDLNPRNTTWLQSANILFLDCPVPCGFSLVEDVTLIPNNTFDISMDVIELLRVFMEEHRYFQTTPFHIFGQSYGASMGAVLAYYLHTAVKDNVLQCSLKGVAMGNGCLSILDTLITWPVMLYQMSLVDYRGFMEMKEIIDDLVKQNATEDYKKIGAADQKLSASTVDHAPCLSIYNIFDMPPVDLFQADSDPEMYSLCVKYKSIYAANISKFMNGEVRKKLGVIPEQKTWQMRNLSVYYAQFDSNDAFKPVWPIIDEILKTSDIDVIIYQGQLDLICNTAATEAWVQKLTWPGLEQYKKAKRKTLGNPETKAAEMFVKTHGHLKFYWVLNSGHAVPVDVPDVALRMLNRILDGSD